jgi:gamma-glutamyltranspeptidase / glutathione hydrolase
MDWHSWSKSVKRPSIFRSTILFSVVLALSGAALIFCSDGCSGISVKKLYTNGALSTVSPIATGVGEKVFAQGGNAADVAVAVGFALAVVYPPAGNIAGGGFALVRNGASGEMSALDFRETAPAAATETMFLDSVGNPVEDASTVGARASGVPGTVAGLHALWKKYGSMSWSDLMAPAIELADSGFVINEALAKRIAEDSAELSRFVETAEIFLPNGSPLKSGSMLIQRDLGRTLKLISRDGPDGFYSGEVAAHITDCMQAHGGIITALDLASYRVQWRTPYRFTFDTLEIVGVPPPSSGGIVIAQILKLIEPYDFSREAPSSPGYIHLFTEAARLAYADRAAYLGDPSFFRVPSHLVDSGYLASRRELIKPDRAGSSDDIGAGDISAYESENTTHFSVADTKGNIVALTYTLNDNFGSRLVVKGAGFLLNDEMDDFSIKPGVANLYGLVGGEANKIAPGKRMLSSMSPTIVLSNGKPLMVLGSPGGSKIITTVAEAIVNFARFHMSADEIVAYPRFHHQWRPDQISFEKEASQFTSETREALTRMGYVLTDRSAWGDLHLICFEPSGILHPAADPRLGGRAGGY